MKADALDEDDHKRYKRRAVEDSTLLMIIVYCDKCGQRVSEEDMTAGRAVRRGENAWFCAACAPAPAQGATQTMKTVSSVSTARFRKPAATTQRVAPGAGASLPKARYKWGIVCLVAGGTFFACCLLYVMFAGSKKRDEQAQAPAPSPAPTPKVSAKEKPRDTEPVKQAIPLPPVKESTSPSPPVPAVKTPTPPESAKKEENATPMQTIEERKRQADKEMEEYRNGRAARMLEEYQAWYKQNPSDPWSYQTKLREITRSYGSAPAAAEARKLLDELKALPPPPDRLEAAAPESKQYQLVYDADLSRAAAEVPYETDNRAAIKRPFDRIAYFMELQPVSGEAQYLYVSMDAFTDDVNKIGVPTAASGAKFQQNVANMNVFSNVKSIVAGTGLSGGNIEFWSKNYGPGNAAKVANADGGKFDFGDVISNDGNYGSMQVHNHDAKQTLFAFNHWVAAGSCDLGIGNRPSDHPDWTFSGSSGSYRMKRLRVLVRLKGE